MQYQISHLNHLDNVFLILGVLSEQVQHAEGARGGGAEEGGGQHTEGGRGGLWRRQVHSTIEIY